MEVNENQNSNIERITADRIISKKFKKEVRMEQITNETKGLPVHIEEARKLIKGREEELARAEHAVKEAEHAVKEAEEVLEKKEFQELLEIVEDKLVPLLQREKENENQINSSMNKLFKKASRDVKKINRMFKDLSELKKEIKNAEYQIAQNGQQDGSGVREAIELKRVKLDQDFEIINQIKGASFLVKQVNIANGVPIGEYQGLLKEEYSHLPVYAQNIYGAVKQAGGRFLQAKIDDLIRLSRLPEPRIVLAREMVLKFLDKLKENKLIVYSLEGDLYKIRDSKA